MSDTLSFTELDAQHVELLPARTVLSLMLTGDTGTVGNNNSSGGNGGIAIAVNAGNINFGSGDQTNVAFASANGGNGGNIHQFVSQKFVHVHHFNAYNW